MRLRTASAARCSVLVLGGTVSADDAAELRRRLDELLVHDTGELVICDLSAVRSADPGAMTVFASHHGLDSGPGPGVCLAGATGEVAELLGRLGIDHVLPV